MVISTIISPEDKLKEIFADVPDLAKYLADEFKRQNPNIVSWDDLNLEQAKELHLNKLKLDSSLQRPLIVSDNGDGLLNIINSFEDVKVATIRVFYDTEHSGEILAWDGQHTLLTLYFIAKYVFEIDDLSDCMVPVAIHPSTDRTVIRKCFLSANGDDKRGLSPIDHFEQEVHSVAIDGITDNKKFIQSYQKQRYLRRYGHFLVNEYQEESEDYFAITRHNEITGNIPKLTKDFCLYRCALKQQGHDALIQPKEQLMMFKYFALCAESNIKITVAYAKRLAKTLKKYFDADFMKFFEKAEIAYKNWHADDMKGRPLEEQCRPRFESRELHGMPYLLDQLKSIGFEGIPEIKKTTPFTVLEKDLWKDE